MNYIESAEQMKIHIQKFFKKNLKTPCELKYIFEFSRLNRHTKSTLFLS